MSEQDGGGGERKDGKRPSRPPRPRAITLKFEEGAPLKLPEEDDGADPKARQRAASEPQLRLDTGEFHAEETAPQPPGDPYKRAAEMLADWSAGRSSAPPAAPKPASPSVPSLDLDLEGLDEKPATRGTMEYSPGMIRPRVTAARPVGTPAKPPPIPEDALMELESLAPEPLPPSVPPAKAPVPSKTPAALRAPTSSWSPPAEELAAPARAPAALEAPAPATDTAADADAATDAEDGPHDGWTRDRQQRRSITPPPAAYRSEHATQKIKAIALPVQAALPQKTENVEALELVDRSRPSRPDVQLDLATEMVDRYALGDFTGSLRAAEMLLGRQPDHRQARQYAESARERLIGLYASRLGTLSQQLEVIVPHSEVRWLGLDHRAGFLLSRMEGALTIEEAIDVSGMPRLEALKTLVDLLDARAIRLRGP